MEGVIPITAHPEANIGFFPVGEDVSKVIGAPGFCPRVEDLVEDKDAALVG
jgi:hypothetical protein